MLDRIFEREENRTHLERDERDALLLVADEEKVFEGRQARHVYADVEEADGEEKLVLLERAGVQLLAHREEEVAVQVADVVDRRLGVFKVEEAQPVVEVRRGGVRVDLDDLEDVDLQGRRARVTSALPGAQKGVIDSRRPSSPSLLPGEWLCRRRQSHACRSSCSSRRG